MTWDGVVPIGSQTKRGQGGGPMGDVSVVLDHNFYIELRVRSAAHRITPCVRVCVVVVRSRGS